jgi:hypothetical protein
MYGGVWYTSQQWSEWTAFMDKNKIKYNDDGYKKWKCEGTEKPKPVAIL